MEKPDFYYKLNKYTKNFRTFYGQECQSILSHQNVKNQDQNKQNINKAKILDNLLIIYEINQIKQEQAISFLIQQREMAALQLLFQSLIKIQRIELQIDQARFTGLRYQNQVKLIQIPQINYKYNRHSDSNDQINILIRIKLNQLILIKKMQILTLSNELSLVLSDLLSTIIFKQSLFCQLKDISQMMNPILIIFPEVVTNYKSYYKFQKRTEDLIKILKEIIKLIIENFNLIDLQRIKMHNKFISILFSLQISIRKEMIYSYNTSWTKMNKQTALDDKKLAKTEQYYRPSTILLLLDNDRQLNAEVFSNCYLTVKGKFQPKV